MPTLPMAELTCPGIYSIKNNITGKMYIGSAANMRMRLTNHNSLLQRGKHHSIKLQRAWNKYGDKSFDIEILEYVEEAKYLLEREQHYIDKMNAAEFGYNIEPIAISSRGRTLTEEHKLKIGISGKGRKQSPETIEKIRLAQKGKTLSGEHLKNVRLANKNRKMTEAHRNALSNGRIAALTGKPLSLEHRKKIQAASIGRRLSPETRAKISLTKRGRK